MNQGIHVTLLAFSLLTGGIAHADKVVRTEKGDLLALTNESISGAADRLAILSAKGETAMWCDNPEPEQARNQYGRDWTRLGGSQIWGVVGGMVYYGETTGVAVAPDGSEGTLHSLNIVVLPTTIADVVELKNLDWDKERERGRDISVNIWNDRVTYGSVARPFTDMIRAQSYPLADEWNLWFNVVYTSSESVTAAAVREGRLLVWHLDGTGDAEREWTAREPVATTIDGPFRIVRAGPELAMLYFIDQSGGIHTGLGAEHRRIGSVLNYDSGDQEVFTLLFEDQQEKKIGFLHAGPDDSLAVLMIEWMDESHAVNFMTELNSNELRQELDRIEDVLREDRPKRE